MINNLRNTLLRVYKDEIQILKTITLFLLVFSTTSSFAQTNEIYFNDLIIQGEPFNKKVNILFEDSVGYLWIGSNTGLYRYDGYNLVSYQQDSFNRHAILNNNINSIIEDENKNLWIGTESFLIHYNRKENKFKGFNPNRTSHILNSDSKGNIFIDLQYTGLAKIDATKFFNGKTYVTNNFKNSILKGKANTFTVDDFGRNWIGTPKGLYVLNKDNSIIESNFTHEIITLENFGNNRFIAVSNHGLFILNYNKTNFNLEILESYPNITNTLNKKATLTSLAKSPNNEDLWIGTTNGLFKAIRKHNSYKFVKYSKESENGKLKNNFIRSIIFDTYGNLWIGTLKGINKYRTRTSIFEYNNIIAQNKTKNDIAKSLLFYSPTDILIGMNSGLYRHNSETNKSTKIHTNAIEIKSIKHNYEKDKLLIASGKNLYLSEFYDSKKNNLKLSKFKTFKHIISDVTVINKNEIWVGLWNGGVDIVNTKNEISEFKKDVIHKLSKNHTSVLLLTKNKVLWIGTRGEGLYKVDLNNETIQSFKPSKENGLTSNAILSLHEDKNKEIWVGTRSGGLNKYIKETNSFKSFRKLNSLSSNTISSIKNDYEGNIWLSTQNGLARFDLKTEKIIPFKQKDGIEESQFIFNSSTSNENNSILYFGCSDGFYTVHSNDFFQKSKLPATVITSFATLGATENIENNSELNTSNIINVNSENPITLPYNQNNIVVNFSSLDLTNPNKNEFLYMLKGLNNYWFYTNASNRNANYNDLSPGKYTFKVKSSIVMEFGTKYLQNYLLE